MLAGLAVRALENTQTMKRRQKAWPRRAFSLSDILICEKEWVIFGRVDMMSV